MWEILASSITKSLFHCLKSCNYTFSFAMHMSRHVDQMDVVGDDQVVFWCFWHGTSEASEDNLQVIHHQLTPTVNNKSNGSRGSWGATKNTCECVDRTNKFLEQIGFGTNFEVSA
jgi:hypothetical protein